jgi:hypothetical protein
MWTLRGRTIRYAGGMKNLLVISALVLSSITFAVPAFAANGDDPCTVVSKSDVAVALKGPVSATKPSAQTLSQTCTYEGQILGHVEVTAYRGNDADGAKKIYTDLTTRMGKLFPGGANISGLGDAAMSIRTAVYVRKGTAVYVFDVLGRPGPEVIARSTALAKATLPRVKG